MQLINFRKKIKIFTTRKTNYQTPASVKAELFPSNCFLHSVNHGCFLLKDMFIVKSHLETLAQMTHKYKFDISVLYPSTVYLIQKVVSRHRSKCGSRDTAKSLNWFLKSLWCSWNRTFVGFSTTLKQYPSTHTTSFWRLYIVHNVKITSYGRQNNVVCVLGL